MSRHRVAYLLGERRLELRREPTPEPGPGEVVVAVRAATTCGTDLKVWQRGGHPRMLRAPCPFGHEVAGEIACVGAGVEPWRAGDAVTVANSASCGACAACAAGRENLCADLQYLNGAFAERLLVPERFVRRSLHRVPAGLPLEVASLAEPLACVLHGLGTVPAGGEAAVLGCGPIGLLFVRALAGRGVRVRAADPVPVRRQVALAMGAADAGEALPPGAFPLVVEATGVVAAWAAALAAVGAGGSVLLFGGPPPGTSVELDTHRLHYGEIRVQGAYHHRPATVAAALELLAHDPQGFRPLLSEERPLAELETALERMERRAILKAVIRP